MRNWAEWVGAAVRANRRMAIVILVFAAGCVNLAWEASRARVAWSEWPNDVGLAAAATPRGVGAAASQETAAEEGAEQHGDPGEPSGLKKGTRQAEPALPLEPSPSPAESAPSPAKSAGRELLDLNRAGLRDLEALPGIGPALARRIVSYREERGPFRSTEQLVEVAGIGPARLRQLAGLVRAGDDGGAAR